MHLISFEESFSTIFDSSKDIISHFDSAADSAMPGPTRGEKVLE